MGFFALSLCNGWWRLEGDAGRKSVKWNPFSNSVDEIEAAKASKFNKEQ